MTRTLQDLATTTDGRRFLEDRMALSADAFVEQLRPPADGALREALDLGGDALPVYVGQQLGADYPPSVVAKFRTMRELDRARMAPFLLWLDTDGAGSSKEITTIRVPSGKAGPLHIRLSARRHDAAEVRFVPVDDESVRSAAHHLRAWGRQNGSAVFERAERLAQHGLSESGPTLADRNLAITSLVLRDALGLSPPAILTSDLVRRGLLTATLNEVLAAIDDVVTVFNGAVDSLEAADIDPQVRRLPDDYLPLHYSCEIDDRRSRLVRAREGSDTYAVARCRGGHEYRFRLGADVLSLGELEATARWSPDVTLPICLNDLTSGVVVGKSSALYGVVLNEVLVKVLGNSPIPMLLPPELLHPPTTALTLVGEYLLGS